MCIYDTGGGSIKLVARKYIFLSNNKIDGGGSESYSWISFVETIAQISLRILLSIEYGKSIK